MTASSLRVETTAPVVSAASRGMRMSMMHMQMMRMMQRWPSL
ncbi:hypothetical protein [Brachybacterium huguangmaarense]